MRIEYSKPTECTNGSWWHDWDYYCCQTNNRELGFRIFGLEIRILDGCICEEIL